MQGIKEALDDMFRPLGNCLDTVRQVVSLGGEALSREELTELDNEAASLKARYERCVSQCDATQRRLSNAAEELSKYDKETAVFSSWMKQATIVMTQKEKLCSDVSKIKNYGKELQDFLGDVIAHQADLRFITISADKFLDESNQFLQIVNSFRSSLPDRYPTLHADPDSEVKANVETLTIEFKDLLSRANRLNDKVSSTSRLPLSVTIDAYPYDSFDCEQYFFSKSLN